MFFTLREFCRNSRCKGRWVGYFSQAVPIFARSVKSCEVWHCPNERHHPSNWPILDVFINCWLLSDFSERACNSYNALPILSDTRLHLLWQQTSFSFPQDIYFYIVVNNRFFIACHLFFSKMAHFLLHLCRKLQMEMWSI